MHKEILTDNQIELLPLLKVFKREFYLVGGTAIAFYLGHRRSIDFDLFKSSPLNHKKTISKVDSFSFSTIITRRVTEQLNITIHNVKFTFYEYPFTIEAKNKYEDYLRMPSLLDLSAMKAYALGRRSKWKDYVDLFFIIKDRHTIKQISDRASELFGQLFSEKLFRAQLSYFNDIDYSEEIEYIGTSLSKDKIKDFLIKKAININE